MAIDEQRLALGPWVRAATRREGEEERPLGPRAARTRAGILAAALRCFAERGYQATTVKDVADAAGISLGAVYQYFRDRQDLVRALVAEQVTRMLERDDPAWRADEGEEGLHRVIGAFVASYAETASMSGLWEEVTHIDEELAGVRRRLGRAFTAVVARELRRGAQRGLLRDDLDPELAAIALTGMVDRACYVAYAFDPPRSGAPDPAAMADVLTKLWSRSIAKA